MLTPITPAVQLRVPPRERPDEQPAPVVADDDRALVAEPGDDAGEARVHPLDVVLDVGLVRPAVAGQVDRDDVEPRVGERSELVAPRVPELGEAVAEQHERTLALLHVVEADRRW